MRLKNWRPLSMLNVDVKIYSKIIANRLYSVLPDIIHFDQAGFMSNRYMGENILDAVSLIEYTEREQIEAMIISVDTEKAFDSTHCETLYSFLEFFNFGPNFCNMIHMLYLNITSCTVKNGYSSPWFVIGHGQRQGCCLSPPLYLIFAEILGLKLRQNKDIEGITVSNFAKKLSQFADDLWVGLKRTQKNIDNFFKELDLFAKITGLHVNYDKTQLMRISSLTDSQPLFYMQKMISWSRRVKILGITL